MGSAPELVRALVANEAVWVRIGKAIGKAIVEEVAATVAVTPKPKVVIPGRRQSSQYRVTMKIIETYYPNGCDDYQTVEILQTIVSLWNDTCGLMKLPPPWPNSPSESTLARWLGRR